MEQAELDETVERARVMLTNANWDEAKHPRGPDGRFGKGNGTPVPRKDRSSPGTENRLTKYERGVAGFTKRMDEIGEVAELNRLHKAFIDAPGGDLLNPTGAKAEARDAFFRKFNDLNRRGLVTQIRGRTAGEAFAYKPEVDAARSTPKVNMGDGHSSGTEDQRKEFGDPTSHLIWPKRSTEAHPQNWGKDKAEAGKWSAADIDQAIEARKRTRQLLDGRDRRRAEAQKWWDGIRKKAGNGIPNPTQLAEYDRRRKAAEWSEDEQREFDTLLKRMPASAEMEEAVEKRLAMLATLARARKARA